MEKKHVFCQENAIYRRKRTMSEYTPNRNADLSAKNVYIYRLQDAIEKTCQDIPRVIELGILLATNVTRTGRKNSLLKKLNGV